MKIGVANKQAVTGIRQFRSDIDLKISMLKKRSIFCIYQIASINKFTRVDLHGLTLEEAYDLVITILDQIYRILNMTNKKR